MIDMKGFAEFHGRTWSPWDKTAVTFMLNLFLGQTRKTNGLFIFALSNIRCAGLSSVMKMWLSKYKTKL